MKRIASGVALAAALTGSGLTDAVIAGDTTFDFNGFVKFDVLSSRYDDGDVGPESPLRDFHFPGAIPVGSDENNYDLDFHVKESRFSFGTATAFEDGTSIRTLIELDFLLSSAGDERVSHSWNPRLRHAYLSWEQWLFGQTWSTFMIVTLPEDLDFAGAAEGIVFIRQPQVRYTWNKWQFAVENPETVVTPLGGGRFATESGRLPDLVARRNFAGEAGTLSIAGLLRQLHYEDPGAGVDDQALGLGATAGGEYLIGDQDGFKAQFTIGRGLGRYVALNFVNAAVLDATNDLHLINEVAGFVDYRHWWSERLRSSFNISMLFADNDANLTGPDVNQAAQSYSGNVIYSLRPGLTIGLELMHAERKLEGDASGSMNRLQFSARYVFGYDSSI
jgi:hypothetical protein